MKITLVASLLVLMFVAGHASSSRSDNMLRLLLKGLMQKKSISYAEDAGNVGPYCGGEVTSPGTYELPRPSVVSGSGAHDKLMCFYFVMAPVGKTVVFRNDVKGDPNTRFDAFVSDHFGMIDIEIPKGKAGAVTVDIDFDNAK